MENKKREKTKDEIAYQDAQKNLHLVTIKLRLSQQGVDTESIPQQRLDMAMRLYDELDKISIDSRNQISQIQNEANMAIQKVNQKTNDRYNIITKKLNEFVNSLKKVDQIDLHVVSEEVVSEEIKETDIKENIVEYLVDIVTKKVEKGIREEDIGGILEKFIEERKVIESKSL